MDLEIVIPSEVPAMTLPNVAFFPQALLPLHIFEPRYRQMLADVLATNRLFTIAGLNEKIPETAAQTEPPHRIATLGIVRACQQNSDGTSNLLIQGLCRVELLEILAEHPYRRVHVRALASTPADAPAEASRLRAEIDRLVALKQKLGVTLPPGLTELLHRVDDTDTFADLAAFNLAESVEFKQQLLETLDLQKRLQLLGEHLRRNIRDLLLQQKLQGRLPEDRIEHN